jgi:23S rRNA (cytidine2498-2'-O)-methyltransferase
VCDVVDKPARVADLVGRWFERGDCRNAIFNLKLPMKRRHEEALACIEHLSARLGRIGQATRLRARQLFHDREEITCVIISD